MEVRSAPAKISDTTHHDVTVKPEELSDLKKATRRLWALDVNRFTPGRDYAINLQNAKMMYNQLDVAKDPLFKGISKEKFFSLRTYKAFYSLLDNYEHETGKAEDVTPEEEKENKEFINAICETPCIKYCHNYLVAKGLVSSNTEAWKSKLYDLWFKLYSRSKGLAKDSSGFEHVFVGEISLGKVSGFHNWIQFFLEEKKGNVDYQGFITFERNNSKVPPDHEQLITIQFTWHDSKGTTVKKPVSSSFVGTSPEFEVALYTLCFLIDSHEDHLIEVGTSDHLYEVNIKCYRQHMGHAPDCIATCFPQNKDE